MKKTFFIIVMVISLILNLILGIYFVKENSLKITFLGKEDNNEIICTISTGIFGKEIEAKDFCFIYNNKVYSATHIGFYNSRLLNFKEHVSGRNIKVSIKFDNNTLDLGSKTFYYKNKQIQKLN